MLSGDAPSSGLLGEMLRGNRRPDGAFVPCPRCAPCSQAPFSSIPSEQSPQQGRAGPLHVLLPGHLCTEVTQAPEGIRTHTRKGQAEAGYTQGSQRFAGTMSHKVTCS